MDKRVRNIWTEYRGAVEEAYPDSGDGRYFVGRDIDDETLERIARLSEQLTAALGKQLGDRPPVGGPPYEELGGEEADQGESRLRLEHEEAAFAAAGIDLAVAADVMEAFLDEADGGAEAVPPVPPGVEGLPPMEVLLALAGEAFGEGGQAVAGGAAPGPPWVIELAGQAIEELVGRGSKPASGFGMGLVTMGFSEVAGAIGSFDPIHRLIDHAGGRLKIGARLLRNGIQKLARIVGSEGFLAWVFEKLIERLMLGPIFPLPVREAAVRRIVRAESSLERVSSMIDAGHTPRDRSQLEKGLGRFCQRFERNMWWAEVAQRLFSRSALVVAVFGFGPGNAALGVANGTGLAVCLFTLADRLDTIPGELGWVRGVPTLIRDS